MKRTASEPGLKVTKQATNEQGSKSEPRNPNDKTLQNVLRPVFLFARPFSVRLMASFIGPMSHSRM